jgi:RNA polymerase sigma-70 factor (ECF subfamily)
MIDGRKSCADFSAIYRDHYPRVVRLAAAMVGDRDAARDIAQDVFIAVLRGPPGFRGDAVLGTWIYRITLRTAARYTARHRRHAGPTVHADELPGDSSAEAATELAELLRALSSLPLASRSVLSLIAIEGLSQEATAEILGLPIGTVWSRLSTARRQLHEALGTQRTDRGGPQ